MSNTLLAGSSFGPRPPLVGLIVWVIRTHGALNATAVLLGVAAYRTESR